jgi:hypothetical protein
VIAVSLLYSLAAGSLQAAPKEERAKQASEREAMIEQLAHKVFSTADHNHNQLLNKREFADAQTMLQTAIAEWGRTRVIGKPHQVTGKRIAKEQETSLLASASAKVSADNLARSNKVTPAEFAFYVHSLVDEADAQWRQNNTAADAQAKALAAERRAMNANRRLRRYAYPAPYSY